MTTPTQFANVDDMLRTLRERADDPDMLAVVRWIEAKQQAAQQNATFHAFKPSGKWYASGRGFMPKATFDVFSYNQQLRILLEANNGRWPGLSGPGSDFTLIVFGDESVLFGFPIMFVREPWSATYKRDNLRERCAKVAEHYSQHKIAEAIREIT